MSCRTRRSPNGVVIYATLPFITALFAWLWFRESVQRRTLIGSLIAGVLQNLHSLRRPNACGAT
jgi:hypothetical protein